MRCEKEIFPFLKLVFGWINLKTIAGSFKKSINKHMFSRIKQKNDKSRILISNAKNDRENLPIRKLYRPAKERRVTRKEPVHSKLSDN